MHCELHNHSEGSATDDENNKDNLVYRDFEYLGDSSGETDSAQDDEAVDFGTCSTGEQLQKDVASLAPLSSFNLGPKKRRSYPLSFKKKVANEYMKSDKGHGLRKIADKYKISRRTLRDWVKQSDGLQDAAKVTRRRGVTKFKKRLPGGGMHEKFPDVEDKCFGWVTDLNQKGIRVTGNHLRIKAKQFAQELGSDDFNATPQWMSMFKKRRKLVMRRETTSRSLPDDAAKVSIDFIQGVRDFIREKNIALKDVLNMDQVPRYYEDEQKTTITLQGKRKVLMRKANTTHRRFTATFTVSAEGDMLKPHILFSQLKNKPKTDPHIFSAVNKTGMWSEEILCEYIEKIVLKRYGPLTSLTPQLLILDSYGCHVKIAESKKYERFNLYMILVPARLTNILQPLDVSLNKPFHAHYSANYGDYIEKAVRSTPDNKTYRVLRTNAIKTPTHEMASKWVADWCRSVPREMIRRSFEACGIGTGEIDIQRLSQPIKELLGVDFDAETWSKTYAHLASEGEFAWLSEMNAVKNHSSSFYEALHTMLAIAVPYNEWMIETAKEITLTAKHRFPDLTRESDVERMKKGVITTGVEILIAAEKFDCKIIVAAMGEDNLIFDTFEYGDDDNDGKVIKVYHHNDVYYTRATTEEDEESANENNELQLVDTEEIIVD